MTPMQKRLMKTFIGFHVLMYHLTGGRFGARMRGFKVLLLTTVGRKTGKRRTNPLGYFRDDENYIVVASNAGMDNHPAWFYNLRHDPNISIQLGSKTIPVTARITQGEERERLMAKIMTEAPAYSGYQIRTTREIPIVVLHPKGKLGSNAA